LPRRPRGVEETSVRVVSRRGSQTIGPPLTAMLGRLLRTRRHRRPALVERLVSFVAVGGFRDPAVLAALRRSRRWQGAAETQRWLREDVIAGALLDAIEAACRPQQVMIPWRTWDQLRPRARFPPWRYATAVSFSRGRGIRLALRPRW